MNSPILQALDTFLKAKQDFSDALQKHSSEDDNQYYSSLHVVNQRLLSETHNTKCISAPDLKQGGIDDVKELETKLADQILKTKKAEKEAKKLKKQIKKFSSGAANEECGTSQENKRVKIKE